MGHLTLDDIHRECFENVLFICTLNCVCWLASRLLIGKSTYRAGRGVDKGQLRIMAPARVEVAPSDRVATTMRRLRRPTHSCHGSRSPIYRGTRACPCHAHSPPIDGAVCFCTGLDEKLNIADNRTYYRRQALRIREWRLPGLILHFYWKEV